jgi:hypothetical protein
VLVVDERIIQSHHHPNGPAVPTVPIKSAKNSTVNIFARRQSAKKLVMQKIF